jgi:SP family general alpha glucoside:H+ symporter-like MFS transporter
LLNPGYDTGLLGSFFGLPQFRNKFGIVVNGAKVIPSDYQAGLQNITRVGQLFGLVLTGYFQEKLGSKKTYIAGMILMTGTIFLAVFAVNLPMLLVAELLMGVPWGMFRESLA